MNVRQLKEHIEDYPDNMEVFLAPRKTEFYYGLLNSVRSKEIKFTEDPSEEEDYNTLMGFDTVVILDEE